MAAQLGKKNKFNAGEISPRLYGRQDLEIFKAGVREALNVIIMPEGGFRKRPSTQYIETASGVTRLIPFAYSHDQAVVLAFSNNTIHFYANKAQIATSTPYTISTPYSESDLPKIVYAQFGGTMYLACEGHTPRKLTRTGETNWTLTSISATQFPYIVENPQEDDIGTGSVTIRSSGFTNSIGSAVIFDYVGTPPGFMDGDDEGRTLIITASGKRGKALITQASGSTTTANGNGHVTGSGTIIEPFSDMTYSTDEFIMSGARTISLTPSATTGTITLTGNYISWYRYAGDIISINGGYVQISTTYDEQDDALSGTVLSTLSGTGATTNWGRVYKITDPDQSPKVVGFYDQRLVYANSPILPQTAFISGYQNFDNFTVGANAADPMNITVGYGQYSAISWLGPSVDLIVGTATDEGSIRAKDAKLTPTTAESISRTSIGSPIQVPLRVDNEILFRSATNRVMSMRFDFSTDNYITQDLTRFAEHLTTSGIVEITYAQKPDNLICAVTGDGDLLLGTYNRQEQVMGWAKAETDGQFESVTSIRQDGDDEIWIVVKRTIDGEEVRYIECLDLSTSYYGMDSYLTYEGESATVISGLDHLEGETVKILSNSAPASSLVVSGGQVLLSSPATSITIGLPYTMRVRTLEHDIDYGTGSSQGQPGVTWVQPILRVFESTTPKINGQTISSRQLSVTLLDSPVPLYTGDLYYSSVDSASLTVEDESVLPVFITAIFGTVSINV